MTETPYLTDLAMTIEGAKGPGEERRSRSLVLAWNSSETEEVELGRETSCGILVLVGDYILTNGHKRKKSQDWSFLRLTIL
jgi:hypothetical protein